MAPSISKKLALTSLASGGRSVGIVHLQTEAMGFFLLLLNMGWDEVPASCLAFRNVAMVFI
jgi:hypothetical protein